MVEDFPSYVEPWTQPNQLITRIEVRPEDVRSLGAFAFSGKFEVIRHGTDDADHIDVMQSILVTPEGIVTARRCMEGTPVYAPLSIAHEMQRGDTYLKLDSIDGQVREWLCIPGRSEARYSYQPDAAQASETFSRLVAGLPERATMLRRIAKRIIGH